MTSRVLAGVALGVLASVCVAAQAGPVPQPFPAPVDRRPAQQPAEPDAPAPQPPEPAPPGPAGAESESDIPTESTLGLPVYPGAHYLASYNAGRGQRFYLFGTNSPFAELVAFYREVLSQRGNLVFEAPATHTFQVGRFREETMAFPPGVTIKDYGWNNSPGYLNPKPNAQPARFRTVIQIVPVPLPDR
jgi:hypothetical protein